MVIAKKKKKVNSLVQGKTKPSRSVLYWISTQSLTQYSTRLPWALLSMILVNESACLLQMSESKI